MQERELTFSIWIHHIATFIGISEGIYYLIEKKQRFWKRCTIFLFTIFQSWAVIKILADLRNGKSRLAESFHNLDKITISKNQKKGILWGMVLSSTIFKVFFIHMLGHE